MSLLARKDLWSLEQYSEQRPAFREKVLAHKKNRKLRLGEHVQLIFEDRLTIQYQIQEMLRIEKIFEGDSIQEELDAYNPLIPEGNNFKCTMFIQFTDVEERIKQLKILVGIEEKIWMKFGDTAPIYPIADEDMDRTEDDKTSAVHFLRFTLNGTQVAAANFGAVMMMGIDHPNYSIESMQVSDEIRTSLLVDLA